jgi:hemerythrin
MISWKEKYAIGNKVIDDQHKMLFEICDKIINLQQDKYIIDKYDRIMDLITELVDYTTFHFHQEEAYMLEINYAGYEEQKAEHDEFIEKLLDVNLGDIDENQDKYIEDLLVFVLDWLSKHIITKDKLIK